MTPAPLPPYRLGFVEGATPDKWARRWRERRQEPIELVPLLPEEQLEALDSGRVDACIARLPVPERCHVVRLYDDPAVVVAPADHLVAAADEVSLADLAEEQLVLPPDTVPGWTEVSTVERLPFPAMGVREAVEVVASGTGVVVVPASVARLHARKDTVVRPVVDGPVSEVALVWLREHDDERSQELVGVVRGRTARSSRGAAPDPARSAAPRSAAPPRRRGDARPAAGRGAQRRPGRGRR
ncbi:LysR family substrate-binding domain-containing protein [Nocardioides perillae]|uniref:DNA-binding transcriptional LysR family regulator n=1 Tax=Nocardioides perillae TaxID=1119534 RepID=A0A7Y9RSL8_9ACTN|nr:DNA-binding transcriptional LysR family regulator [Nocardioides perillae]